MVNVVQLLLDFLSTSYNGVDHKVPGNGGIDCYDYLTFKQRLLDTCAFTVFAGLFIVPRVLSTLSLPKEWEIISMCRKRASQRITGARKFILILLCIVFGLEIGYKITKETWVYLLNPCHMLTIMQIYLLSAEPTRTCTAVFRVHMHLIFGAFLAAAFPVLNTRERTVEKISYWVQHFLITVVIPPYLISTGGAYRCESITDFSWPLLTILIFGFYMFYVLQSVGMVTLANVNNMLCPAVSDPFHGPNYRWWAIVHQQLLILLFGKLYTLIIYSIIKLKDFRRKVEESPQNNNCYIDAFDENKGK